MTRQGRFIVVQQAARVRQHLRTLRALPWPELRQHVADKLGRRDAQQRAVADPLLARRARVEEATMAAVRRHRPRHFAGRVCLALPNAQWQHANDRQLGWPAALGSPMEEYCGPDGCEGHSMLLAPNVLPFADFLRHCLDRS